MKRFKRYVENLKTGIVVYRSGFKENLFNINQTGYAREVQALVWF